MGEHVGEAALPSMIRPASITPTRWQISLMTVISWVNQHDGDAEPGVHLPQQAQDGAGGLGSSALVASSESSTRGSVASARAMPTRCFCPPESSIG